MTFSEDILASFRDWHRDKIACAFLALNEEAIVLFSSLNIVPDCIEGSFDNNTSNKSQALLSLKVHSRCCNISGKISEKDRLGIVQLLRTRLCPQLGSSQITNTNDNNNNNNSSSIISNSNSIMMIGIPNDINNNEFEVNEEKQNNNNNNNNNIVKRLQEEFHMKSCWWRLGEILQILMQSPHLSLTSSAIIRNRCSAVVVMENNITLTEVTNKNINNSTNSLINSGAKLLLPRGSPASFIRDKLLPPTLEWMQKCVTQSLSGLTSTTPIGLLHVIFGLKKRNRQMEENESNNNSNNNKVDNDNDIIRPVCILLALFGYIIREVPSSLLINDKCVNSKDENINDIWKRLNADVLCYFCGEKPSLIVEKLDKDQLQEDHNNKEDVIEEISTKPSLENNNNDNNSEKENSIPIENIQQNEKEKEEVTNTTLLENNSNEKSLNSQLPKITSQHNFLNYKIILSEQSDSSGHHANCPWRELFLQPVLQNALTSSPSREVNFNINNKTYLLQFHFKLPEVAKLMECWRRSLYAESVWRELYFTHPLPTAVRSVIPPPGKSEMEKYLKELTESSHQVKNNISNSLSHYSLKNNPTPLFDNCSFWDSLFRVTSFINAASSEKEKEENVESTMNNNNNNNNIINESYWKSVYDAGRQCLLAAAEGKDKNEAAELFTKFTDLYQKHLQQEKTEIEKYKDKKGNDETSIKSVICKITELLGAGINIRSNPSGIAVNESIQKIVPPLSPQKQKRVQTFLDTFETIVENATREPPAKQQITQTSIQPTHLNQMKRPHHNPSSSSSSASASASHIHSQHLFPQGVGIMDNNNNNIKQGGINIQQQQQQQQQMQRPQQQYQHQQNQHYQRNQKPLQQQMLYQQSSIQQYDGIFPSPNSSFSVGAMGVLSSQAPILLQQSPQSQLQQNSKLQQQQQKQQQNSPFQSPGQGITFMPHTRNPNVAAESIGVLGGSYNNNNNNNNQRPSVMGQRRQTSGNFNSERKSGINRGGGGGAHRGGRRGGRGGGNSFKG